MPSRDVVVQLNRELAGTKVLSVYLNAEETDPAERRAWRIRLNALLKGLEDGLAGAPEEERRAARAAAALLGQELERYDGLLPGRGWVGFASAEFGYVTVSRSQLLLSLKPTRGTGNWNSM